MNKAIVTVLAVFALLATAQPAFASYSMPNDPFGFPPSAPKPNLIPGYLPKPSKELKPIKIPKTRTQKQVEREAEQNDSLRQTLTVSLGLVALGLVVVAGAIVYSKKKP